MATEAQLNVLKRYFLAAKQAKHVWPEYAACEAALESSWGTSELAVMWHNLFGQKCPQVDGEFLPPAGSLQVTLPTWEVIHGERVDVNAVFLCFPHDADAFRHRMALLEGAAHEYPEYAAALKAETGAEFVELVSKRWSTDPKRAADVIEIHDAHVSVFE